MIRASLSGVTILQPPLVLAAPRTVWQRRSNRLWKGKKYKYKRAEEDEKKEEREVFRYTERLEKWRDGENSS